MRDKTYEQVTDSRVNALCVQDAAGRGSVKLVQIKGSNSDWESLNNVWGASWETGQVPDLPLDFRIQDDAGVEVSQVPPCSIFMFK